MSYRMVEVICSKGHGDTIKAIAEKYDAKVVQFTSAEDDLEISRILAPAAGRQNLLDNLQTVLKTDPEWRLVIMPVEGTLPMPGKKEAPSKPGIETREELYSDMLVGADGGRNFILLVVLSTIVAAIGLLQDDVAIVIGAMVIAPLLGPNLAFAFAVAMGDRPLMFRALRTSGRGILIALGLSILLGLIWTGPMESKELIARTHVGFDSLGLAIASGLAAALSLTTGVSAVLVGVMVAVALLPPTASLGIFLGSGQFMAAIGAAMLLVVNVASVILAAQIVFILKGIGPRTWWEKRRAKASLTLNMWLLSILLTVLIGLIVLQQRI
jgi:uncharacterized hydrophobic protein (TIGR00341 family)